MNNFTAQRKWNPWYSLVAFIVLPVGMLLAGIIPIPSTRVFSQINSGAILNTIQFIIAICFLFIILRYISKLSRVDIGIHAGNPRKYIVMGIGLGVVYYFFTELSEFLFPSLQVAAEQVNQSLGIGKSLVNDILLLLSVVFLAPIVEEVIFRGVMFQSLLYGLQKYSWFSEKRALVVAVIFSSMMFSAIHGGTGQDAQTIFFILLGLVTAIGLYRTGNIMVSILVHGINNIIVLMMVVHSVVGLNSQYGMVLLGLSIVSVLLYAPILKFFGRILTQR